MIYSSSRSPADLLKASGLTQKWVTRQISNFEYFVSKLDSKIYYTDFDTKGQCNYAFIVIMRKPDSVLRDKIENALKANGIEFRRGLSGGGNQLRQPYFKDKNILRKSVKKSVQNPCRNYNEKNMKK